MFRCISHLLGDRRNGRFCFPAESSNSRHQVAWAAIAAVEPMEQRVLFSVFTVTSAANSGLNTLRQAILDSNASVGVRDTIKFHIGSGQQTIVPTSALPVVTDPVIIDASTQPGAPGAPRIVLSGASAGASTDGLVIAAGHSVVKGFVINGFSGNGITLRTHDGDVILGNYIGTNAAGATAVPNGGDGILVDGRSFNQIGGTTALERNVVSGNGSKVNFPTLARDGIHLKGPGATHNLVEGNYLGTDATGTLALGNSKFGIELDNAAFNTVGGTGAGAGNLVSANTAGIEIDNGGNHNTIQGNTVGTQVNGLSPLGNTLHGVVFGTGQHNDNNLIGGTTPGAGNTIGQNGTGGVAVFGSTSTAANNSILGNSIFSNGRNNPGFLLGIDLVPTLPFPTDDGVTANDSNDADTGPNNLQNFPVLLTAHDTASGVNITGALQSLANVHYRIEFFSNPSPNPNSHPEGQVFLGSATAFTNSTGQAFFSVHLSSHLTGGPLVTATATSSGGSTSEFSAAIRAQ